MSRETFYQALQPATDIIGANAFDAQLTAALNAAMGPESAAFDALEKAVTAATVDGWVFDGAHKGLKFGRPVKPSPETHNLSVDVVRYRDQKGPYHRHPNGEVCLVLPVDDGAEFDGCQRGWCVYPAGSGHYPEISRGEAIVVYWLPEGAIDFKATPPAADDGAMEEPATTTATGTN